MLVASARGCSLVEREGDGCAEAAAGLAGRALSVRRREAADAGHTPWQVAAKRDEPTGQYERAGSVKVVPQLAKVVKAQTRAGEN